MVRKIIQPGAFVLLGMILMQGVTCANAEGPTGPAIDKGQPEMYIDESTSGAQAVSALYGGEGNPSPLETIPPVAPGPPPPPPPPD